MHYLLFVINFSSKILQSDSKPRCTLAFPRQSQRPRQCLTSGSLCKIASPYPTLREHLSCISIRKDPTQCGRAMALPTLGGSLLTAFITPHPDWSPRTGHCLESDQEGQEVQGLMGGRAAGMTVGNSEGQGLRLVPEHCPTDTGLPGLQRRPFRLPRCTTRPCRDSRLRQPHSCRGQGSGVLSLSPGCPSCLAPEATVQHGGQWSGEWGLLCRLQLVPP